MRGDAPGCQEHQTKREPHFVHSLSERPKFRSTRRKDRVHLLQVDAETKDAVGLISDSSRLSVARLVEKHHGSGALLRLMCLQAWKLRVSSCLRSPIGRRSIGRASFRRSPVSGQKCFTVLSPRINNNYAERHRQEVHPHYPCYHDFSRS